VVAVLETARPVEIEGQQPTLDPGTTVILLAEVEGEVLCAGPSGRLFKLPSSRVPDLFRNVDTSSDPLAGGAGLGALLSLLLVGGGALCAAEAEGGGSITDLGDALWYGINTVSTVGVGDVAPETPAGKLIASAMMALGNPLYARVGQNLLGS
jgi:hypothetical protein